MGDDCWIDIFCTAGGNELYCYDLSVWILCITKHVKSINNGLDLQTNQVYRLLTWIVNKQVQDGPIDSTYAGC